MAESVNESEQLTELQEVILEIEKLDLPLHAATRMATQRVGFFVGQARYQEERRRALELARQLGRR